MSSNDKSLDLARYFFEDNHEFGNSIVCTSTCVHTASCVRGTASGTLKLDFVSEYVYAMCSYGNT